MIDDTENLTQIPEHLKAFLQFGTCIQRNDPIFWNKLTYELNHHTKSNFQIEDEGRDNQEEVLPSTSEQTRLLNNNSIMA